MTDRLDHAQLNQKLKAWKRFEPTALEIKASIVAHAWTPPSRKGAEKRRGKRYRRKCRK